MANRLSPAVGFFKKEIVLCISALAAALSMLITPPGPRYIAYIDWDVLMLLFSLMAVSAGLRGSGLWDRISQGIVRRTNSQKKIALGMVLLCFFSAMLVTNDVALLTFVPLCLTLLRSARKKLVISTVVLMTIAANLGSMATPVGNPQNLFLYSAYGLTIGTFLRAIVPLACVSLVLILGSCIFLRGESFTAENDEQPTLNVRTTAMYGVLFAVCLLAVVDVLPVWTAFTLAGLLCVLFDRETLCKIDYSLLATFVFFFILAGNLAASAQIRLFLQRKMEGSELLLSALLSQCISNVPAAVLLRSFTENWKALLLGVNIGGLGTPIASLASLISYRIYARSEGAAPGKYMAVFLAWNAGFLVLLYAFAVWMIHI